MDEELSVLQIAEKLNLFSNWIRKHSYSPVYFNSCRNCGEVYSTKYPFTKYCSIKCKRYYPDNREREKIAESKYQKQNAEKLLIINKNWCDENRTQLRKKQQEWRDKNKNKIRCREREYYAENIEDQRKRKNEYEKRRRHEDIEYRNKKLAYNRDYYHKNKSEIGKACGNKLGIVGIVKYGEKYRSRISVHGKTYSRIFDDFFEACCARKSAESLSLIHI